MEPIQPLGPETLEFLRQHFPESYLNQLKRLAGAVAGRKAGPVDPSGLVIDAILQAARHHRQLKNAGNLNGWVRTILVREVLAKLNLECYRRTQQLDAADLRQGHEPCEGLDLLVREEEKSQAKAYLEELLARLSEEDQEVICLTRIQDLSDAEAARLLEITEVNLRKRRSRALQRLHVLAKKVPAP